MRELPEFRDGDVALFLSPFARSHAYHRVQGEWRSTVSLYTITDEIVAASILANLAVVILHGKRAAVNEEKGALA